VAGLRACEALREQGFEGRLRLVGREGLLPYDRPPLSKQLLAGTWDKDRCTLRTSEELEALGIELDLGTRAAYLDLAARTVALSGGRSVSFDGLVIATGATPRPLPGVTGRPAVLTLRDLDDAIALRAVISAAGARLVIAGAGLIGLEVAATARGLGAEVTVVEPLAVPLEGAVGPLVGSVCERVHRDHGVDLRLGTRLDSVEAGARPAAVTCRLSDGTSLGADALLVAVGALAATSWLAGSGLDVGPAGLTCDASLTAAPGVVAAGDLVRWPHPRTGEYVQVEHRTNAAEQGEHAARSLLAGDGPRPGFAPVPYVWSDQYDYKIQVIGMHRPADEAVVVDGSLEDLSFLVVFGRGGRLTGALGFNRSRALTAYRALLEQGASFAEALALTQV